MQNQASERHVDHSALKVNQTLIIALLLLAFILDNWLLAAFVGLVMLLGTATPALSVFKGIYNRLLRPAGIVKPRLIIDNPEPHRFAQGLGGLFVALAVGALLVNQPFLGWGLVWLVIVLAAMNLFLGFCAGCFFYYQLNRMGLPGFTRKPVGN